jgi:hypothetical protein
MAHLVEQAVRHLVRAMVCGACKRSGGDLSTDVPRYARPARSCARTARSDHYRAQGTDMSLNMDLWIISKVIERLTLDKPNGQSNPVRPARSVG